MTTALAASALDLPAPSAGLDAYVQRVQRFPLLSEAREQALARRWREERDLDAARELVLSHLRFVVCIARQYLGYGLPLADLIQEGNVGLMKAVKHFDPTRGARLATYAAHWVKAEIHDFVLRNWRIVKVATTKAQRKLFFKLRGEKKRLNWLKQAEAERVAERLEVDPETVTEMESRLAGRDLGYDGAGGDESDDDTGRTAPAAYLTAEDNDPLSVLAEQDWQEKTRARFARALARLDGRSREIIERRWLGGRKATLQELAGEYGVSAERVRQLEAAAIDRLRSSVLSD